MEFDMKKDSRRILVIVLASALMAFNIFCTDRWAVPWWSYRTYPSDTAFL